MHLPPHALELAEIQLGVLTRRQLLQSGVTPAELRTRVGREWRLLLRGVVLLGNGLPDVRQRLVAALLYAGPGSWLAGSTAAALHGVPGLEICRPVRVLVAAPHRARDHAWVSIRNTTLVDERVHERGALRLSCPARAVVDAAAEAPTDELATAIIVGAAQNRIARLDDLAHWTAARGARGSTRMWQALERAATGAWSVPETELLALLSTSPVLPPVWPNPELRDPADRRLTTPDAWLDDVALAVMVHSKKFHAGDLDWEATVEHDTDLQAARVIVVGVTPRSISQQPERTLKRIETAYLTARASGLRAEVTATQRDPWLFGRANPQLIAR
jgi:hypothetical protein